MYEQHESNALSKSNVNNSTSNSVHEINHVYFVFLLLSKNTNLQWAWKPLPTLIKEQQTVLALNCAKRESTAEASGSANTPSVITTAPDQKQNKPDRNLCKMVFYSNRAANLWRTKIWRPSLFHYNPPPPLRKFNEPYHSSPPLINMGMIEDIMWGLTWTTNYQNLWYHFDARNNLCHDQWLNRCKNAPETVLRIRKFKFWAKNGLNLKLRHRKAQKMILSGTYGDLYGRLGD